jgi:hypothetical protein
MPLNEINVLASSKLANPRLYPYCLQNTSRIFCQCILRSGLGTLGER